MYKNQRIGKFIFLEEPFSINGRKYCKVECCWCGRQFQTQLRQIKRGKGCQCTFNSYDLLGKKFGKLTAVDIVDTKNVKCLCECGNIKIINKYNLLSGNSKTCGCDHYNNLLERNLKHGKSHTRIYHIYLSMKMRCYNPNTYAYKWYGMKGIRTCDEWLGEKGFDNFYDWAINNGYNDTLSIERIDVDKNYCPNNCKWIPVTDQRLNTSHTICIEGKNGLMTVKDLSEKLKIPKSTIYSRIKKFNKRTFKEEELM